MKTLMTCEEVVAMTFSADEQHNVAMITEADIVEAESRYLSPILGQELCEALAGGSYENLMSEYVKPALAACVRYVAEPYQAQRCPACRGESLTSADNQRLDLVLLALRRRARSLIRRLSDHLNAHSADYEEYSAQNNPKNRCMIYGDIVQIR